MPTYRNFVVRGRKIRPRIRRCKSWSRIAAVIAPRLDVTRAQGSLPFPSTPPVRSDWAKAQALPAGTALHLNGNPQTSCLFLRADADSVICGRQSHERTCPRAGTRSIKLSRRTPSTLVGLGIGAGTGAIIGFAVGTRKDDFSGNNAFRSGISGVFAALGGVAGAPIGYLTDFTAGSAIYKALQTLS